MGGVSLFSANASKATLTDVQLAGAQAPRSVWHRSTLTRSDFTGARSAISPRSEFTVACRRSAFTQRSYGANQMALTMRWS